MNTVAVMWFVHLGAPDLSNNIYIRCSCEKLCERVNCLNQARKMSHYLVLQISC